MALFDNRNPIMFSDLISEGFKISLSGNDEAGIATFRFERHRYEMTYQISYDEILQLGDRDHLEKHITMKVLENFGKEG